ncbi:hypothetical protein ACIRYZ_41535 [Kitasatospora sp. NPDC101155]|uniref:hypothetical protein n=1 Tax=Kitasatospora sp. NPDC101155 TaxID=3364097 RepID=UPI0037F3EDB5
MVSIGRLTPSDRQDWEALFRSYIDFYERALPAHMYERAWTAFQAARHPTNVTSRRPRPTCNQAPADAQPAHPWRNVVAGSILNWNQSWTTPSGRTVLTMQTDGNVVLYKDGAAIWASWTVGTGHHLSMQGDGNLVVYNWGNSPVWSSGTAGSPGAVLSIQEGNMAIFQGDRPLWYTNFPPRLINTCQPYPHYVCP